MGRKSFFDFRFLRHCLNCFSTTSQYDPDDDDDDAIHISTACILDNHCVYNNVV